MEKLSKTKVKELSKLKQKKYREKSEFILLEGKRLISQVLSYGIILEELYLVDPEDKMNFFAKETYQITTAQLTHITNTRQPQKVAAVVKKKFIPLQSNKFLLYLDDIKEPGNLGTIIRTALAFDMDGIVLSPFCCEYYNPKVVRASLGGVFKLPLIVKDHLWLKKQNAIKLALAMDNSENILQYSRPKENLILILGSEAFGISKKNLEIADDYIKIPISKKMESLNVATAAAIAMFHFVQRKTL